MDTPIISVKNQFAGINSILNDILQVSNKWGWEEFHHFHIDDLTIQIVMQLEGTAYTAHVEEGLQIRWRDDAKLLALPESDLLITHPEQLPQVNIGLQAGGNFIAVPAIDLVADILHFYAIGIYRTQRKQGDHPVAWIELLSPTNKPGGRHWVEYLEKRQRLLETGDLCFIELDYLNQSSPTIVRNFPDYTQQHPGSTPYRILITDTRPLQNTQPAKTLEDSETLVAGFGVDQPIPMLPLILPEIEPIHIDLQSAYNTTYERVRYGTRVPIDYRPMPDTFGAYMEADQQRMITRLEAVRLAHQNGVNLNEISTPLPLDTQ